MKINALARMSDAMHRLQGAIRQVANRIQGAIAHEFADGIITELAIKTGIYRIFSGNDLRLVDLSV
ncbi:hypothetical protein [Pseudomonas sp. efr-133-TYG-103a]|uniref:hypothetical protein n=1 Tax=Pseudomonas sp. efr-133-TYG-103a TaxID=3040308 RepID=UPI00255799FC|nr:hypothetical protein [Pseudomonas sp. efr-133-TYG-103a]